MYIFQKKSVVGISQIEIATMFIKLNNIHLKKSYHQIIDGLFNIIAKIIKRRNIMLPGKVFE